MSYFRYAVSVAAMALFLVPGIVSAQESNSSSSPSYVGSPSNPIGASLPPEKTTNIPVEVPMPMMQFPPLQTYQFHPVETLRTDPAQQFVNS